MVDFNKKCVVIILSIIFPTFCYADGYFCVTDFYWSISNNRFYEQQRRDAFIVTPAGANDIKSNPKVKWIIKPIDGANGEIGTIICEHKDIDQIVCFEKGIYDIQTFVIHNRKIGNKNGDIIFTSYYHEGMTNNEDVIRKGTCKEIK